MAVMDTTVAIMVDTAATGATNRATTMRHLTAATVAVIITAAARGQPS